MCVREARRCSSCLPLKASKCCNATESDGCVEEQTSLKGTDALKGKMQVTSDSQPVPVPDPERPTSGCALYLPSRKKILRRIPRASREQAARRLSSLLDAVVSHNTYDCWLDLFCYAQSCLKVPRRGKKRLSLASMVNNQIRIAIGGNGQADNVDLPLGMTNFKRKRQTYTEEGKMKALANKVSAKIEEGNFKGAIRLICSEDKIADYSEDTFKILQQKHPKPHPDSDIPGLFGEVEHIGEIPEPVVRYAIRSFPCWSAGGPDGLRPQHIKDMIGFTSGESGVNLLQSLSSFVGFVLCGEVLASVRPCFFGANSVAFNKSDGGIRPIAVGCTLHRLVAKCAGLSIREEMGELLAPIQLGYGVKHGAEAAVHAARRFLKNLQNDQVLVKLDFQNAFNTLRRDRMLRAVEELAPSLLPYVHSVYCSPTSLFWGNKTLESSEGVQQGYPLGPLLFLPLFTV